MRQKEKQTKRHGRDAQIWRPAFARQNYAITALAVVFIVAGMLLMLPEADVRNRPGGRFASAPGPGAFAARRIKVAPVPCFIGFALMVPAIMYVPKRAGEVEREKRKVGDV